MSQRFVTCFCLIVFILTLTTGCDDLAILSPKERTGAFYLNINLSNQGNEKSFYTFLTYNIHMGFNAGQDFQNPDDIGATQKHL
ncbi:MAG: hypothetical protein O6943_04615, partial [Bacteroidetes bacterium]|nr:hypothetical protein [Bacteroidota bacterium]